mmetsp:Transcript_83563/g.132306  ORF Transcript_83563/g.132306 Transcript_83563/m.132306 type:complete len:203 (+) Transcript_83563:45-653(+)
MEGTGDTTLKADWLQVFEEGTWKQRWCVLQAGSPVALMSIFSDSSCSSKTGLIELTASSKADNMESPSTEFGFTIEASPSSDPWSFASGDAKTMELWLKAVQSAAMEDTPIDDFSDYEDDRPKPRSSIVERFDADWKDLQPGNAEPAEVPELAIDDFSDYEDDEHARRSSWQALEEQAMKDNKFKNLMLQVRMRHGDWLQWC